MATHADPDDLAGVRADFDVVVVGARPAGAAAAMLLARRGLSVLVIDRTTPGTDVVSTHALMRPAVMQLQRWGLLDAVIASGAPPVRTITFHYGDDHVSIPVKPTAEVDALYAPRRTVLDPIIATAAAAAGATVRHRTTAVALRRDSAGAVVGVDVADRSGVRRTFTSRLVIGADGRSSSVARMCDATTLRSGNSKMAYVYAHVAGLDVDGYHWNYVPGLAAGAIPTNDATTCVFVGMRPGLFEREVRSNVGAQTVDLLRIVAPDVAHAIDLRRDHGPIRYRVFPGETGWIRRSHGPGWALVGDAGYFKDPITAHGITDALLDAERLADAVVRTLDGSETAALATYQSERDESCGRLFDITDAIAGLAWDLDELQQLHLGLSQELANEARAIGPAPLLSR